ncbi:MAG: hypothetical protein QM779_03555 [Propionicimonas sp.]|uniref:hypothetical protein n=1 Tax=Propionicimonas sp. TaxID=1955623 RepID=UPI003D0AF616
MTQTPLAPTPVSEFPVPAPSRSPQLLRQLQALVALVVLLAGAVGAWVISDLRDDLASVPNLAQQYARLGQVQHALSAANDLAVRSVLLGESASGTHATAAATQVATANGLIVQAATDRPQDATALADLGEKVLRYSASLAAVAGTSDAAARTGLTASSSQLDDLLASIDNLQGELATEASSRPWSQTSPWAVIVIVVMLGVAGWASWLVARLSHRAVNPGLAGAVAALLLLLVTGVAAQSTAVAASVASRDTEFTHVVNATTAVRQVDTAQRVVTTAVLDQSWDADAQAGYTAAYKAATAAGEGEDLGTLSRFDKQRTAITDALAKGDPKTATSALLSDDSKAFLAAADDFRETADTTSGAAVQAAADEPAAARSELVFHLVATILLALAGAVAGVLGIARRLREYA